MSRLLASLRSAIKCIIEMLRLEISSFEMFMFGNTEMRMALLGFRTIGL